MNVYILRIYSFLERSVHTLLYKSLTGNFKDFQIFFVTKNLYPYFCRGEVAEWSIAAVLKTVEGQTSGGSNPSLSAEAWEMAGKDG